jgi:hypothetical protein
MSATVAIDTDLTLFLSNISLFHIDVGLLGKLEELPHFA